MKDRFAMHGLSARAQGAVTTGIGCAVAGVGWAVHRMLEDAYYPVMFPCAGLLISMGALQMVGGISRKALMSATADVQRLAFMAIVLGVVAGLLANRFFYGRLFA